MGNPVAGYGFDDRVATDDFTIRLGSRVTIIGRFDVRSKDAAQFWQAGNELDGNGLGLFRQFADLFFLDALETETCHDLLREQVAEAVNIDADVIGQCLAAQRGLPIEAGKQDGAAKIKYLSQCRSRGQRVAVSVFIEETIQRIRLREVGDGLLQQLALFDWTHGVVSFTINNGAKVHIIIQNSKYNIINYNMCGQKTSQAEFPDFEG